MNEILKKSTITILTALLAFIAVMCTAVFVSPGIAYAEDITSVTIGDGTDTTTELPSRLGWKYSRSQMIYPASEIGTDGAIVSIGYEVAQADPGFKIDSMKIWMGYTDLDKYDYDKTGTVGRSEYTLREPDITLVYDGALDIGTGTGWSTIELTEPFDYDHTQGNLVIVTGVYTNSTETSLRYFGTVYGKSDHDHDNVVALVRGDDDNASLVTLEGYDANDWWVVMSSRPNIQLDIDTSAAGEDATFDVSFDTDGGSPVPETQAVAKGGNATEPEEPTRDRYRFDGWYKGDKPYNFDSRVNSSFTLTAHWVRLHTIRFLSEDGSEVLDSQTVEEGKTPEYSGETPTKAAEGDIEYVFAGWDPAVRAADSDQDYKAVFIDSTQLADKTALNVELKAAKDLQTGIRTSSDQGRDVGSKYMYVTPEERQAYDDAQSAAQATSDAPYATQEEVDKATADLKAAEEIFKAAWKDGSKVLPAIEKIVIASTSGRQQPAKDGTYEWIVTFAEGADLSVITDDDFQVQRKPSGADWKNSKCPVASFTPSEREGEENIGTLKALAIPDNEKEGDNTNLWRFTYAGDSVECPVITQDGYVYVEKKALEAAITNAEEAQKNVHVSADGRDIDPADMYVTQDEKDALDSAVAEAQAVLDSDRVTQADVDRAAAALNDVIDTYVQAKKAGREQAETGGYRLSGYRLIYETVKVKLADIPVRELGGGKASSGEPDAEQAEWYSGEPLEFEFYNSTLQRSEGIYTTSEGTYTDEEGEAHTVQMLSGVELIRGHNYIVSAHDKNYVISNYYTVTIDDDGNGNSGSYRSNMLNYYINLSEDGKAPIDIKKEGRTSRVRTIDIQKRTTNLADAADGRRVSIRIPVYYTQDGTFSTALRGVSEAIIKLSSPEETLYVTSDNYGYITASLLEDTDYMVSLEDDSGAVAISSFPLTVKDHAENGWPKSIYNHFSCGSVQGLYLVDKQYEHDRDTTMVSLSGKTEVTGANFRNDLPTDTDHYFIYDRQLDNSMVSKIKGRDYEVFEIDSLNMYRTELSRLAEGEFKITRTVPEGREVDNVYYINKSGNLKKLNFAQTGDRIEFTMNSLSMYPNVIVYKPAASQVDDNADAPSLRAGASAAAAEKAIKKIGVKNDKEPAGTKFGRLRLRSTKQTKKAITVKWTSAKGASKYVLYGNLSGKGHAMKKIGSTSAKSRKVSKIDGAGLKAGKYYKFIVVALDSNDKVVSTSKVIHVATKGGKAGNYKSVTTKAKKNKVTVKKGKTFKLRAKQVKASKKSSVKKHGRLRYESSNTKIAVVSKKGVIKGKKKGTCYVYAYTQSGTYKRIKVTVK